MGGSRRWFLAIGAAGALALATRACGRRKPDKCPDSRSKWQLWYHDLFDREGGGKEAEGKGILEGLALLWRKDSHEGVDDRGRSTFTTFSIRWGEGTAAESASVHRDPVNRPGLAKIRSWSSEELFVEIARSHLRLLEKSDRWDGRGILNHLESMPILVAAVDAKDAKAFVRALKDL